MNPTRGILSDGSGSKTKRIVLIVLKVDSTSAVDITAEETNAQLDACGFSATRAGGSTHRNTYFRSFTVAPPVHKNKCPKTLTAVYTCLLKNSPLIGEPYEIY